MQQSEVKPVKSVQQRSVHETMRLPPEGGTAIVRRTVLDEGEAPVLEKSVSICYKKDIIVTTSQIRSSYNKEEYL